MPTKPRKVRRRQAVQLDESIEQYFLTGDCERDTPGWRLKCSRFFDNWKEINETWAAHREFLLKKWKSEKRGRSWAEDRFEDE